MDPTNVPVPSLGATFGALYIGAILATVLYGFTTNQAFVYFKTYGDEDARSTQLLVFGLWALDSLQVVLVVHMAWYYLIEGFQNPVLLSGLVWSFCLELGVTVLVTFIVRALYMKQLWRLSERRLWLVGPAFIFAAAQLGLGLQTTINMLCHPNVEIVTTKSFQWILGSKCVTSVLADVIITLSLCYFLHTSRTGFKKTNDLVNSLLMYTINRGLLAMMMEATVMVTFLTMKDNFIFAALHLMLGKLHTSSLFALLLQRDTLRSRQDLDTSNDFSQIVGQSEPNATQCTPHAQSIDISVMVTSETIIEHSYRVEDQHDNRGRPRRGRKKRFSYNVDPISW